MNARVGKGDQATVACKINGLTKEDTIFFYNHEERIEEGNYLPIQNN